MQAVALVTGASRGIGEAVARKLAQHGYFTVLAARSAEALERVAGEIRAQGGGVFVVPTDVTQREQVAALGRQTLERFGRIDVLVNNAGIAPLHCTLRPTDEEIDAVLTTNLLSIIWLTRAVLPTMLQQRSGHVINIASVSGHIALPTCGLYVTSKFGLRGYNHSLRRELYGSGVKVSLITPGFIRTRMLAGLHLPLPMPEPENVARAVSAVLRRPRRELVIPGWYRPLIGLHRWMPGVADWVLNKFWPCNHHRNAT